MSSHAERKESGITSFDDFFSLTDQFIVKLVVELEGFQPEYLQDFRVNVEVVEETEDHQNEGEEEEGGTPKHRNKIHFPDHLCQRAGHARWPAQISISQWAKSKEKEEKFKEWGTVFAPGGQGSQAALC